MSLPIIVFGDTTGRYISAIESQRGEVSVARHIRDISDLLGLAQTGIARAALIVGANTELTLSFIEQLRSHELAVVMVTQPEDRPGFTNIKWVSTLASHTEIVEVIIDAVDELERQDRRELQPQPTRLEASGAQPSPLPQGAVTGSLITVWSGYGSPGRTTVAINLAACAARQGYRVCLVDADTYAPSVSSLTGMLEEFAGLSQLCYLADRGNLDSGSLTSAKSTIAVGSAHLDILTGITRTERWPEIREQSLTLVLEFLRQQYDLVIIDTAPSLEEDEELSFDAVAPRRNAATRTALKVSDAVVLLGSGDVLGIPRLIRAHETLMTFYTEHNISPITSIWINKTRKQAIGTHPQDAIERAWQRFGPAETPVNFLPHDQITVDRSWLSGCTLMECAPKTELALAIEEIFTFHRSLLESLQISAADTAEEGQAQRRYSTAERKSGARLSPRIRKLMGGRQKISEQ